MTEDQRVVRLLETWLESEMPTAAPPELLDRIDIATRPIRPRPAWVASLEGHHMDVIEGGRRTGLPRLGLALVVMAVVIALVAAVAFVASPRPAIVGECPATLNEADAVDTFVPGLSQAERAWGIAGGTPGPVRPGPIAGFAFDAENAPLSVLTIDPTTGARCRLVRMVAEHVVRIGSTTLLDWSPSGDALAIGIERFRAAGQEDSDGQALIWTPDRLFRVWLGPGQHPHLEWAPDGRSIAIWMPSGTPTDVMVVHADGSPDGTFGVRPWARGLKWSPDGSRWVIAEVQWDLPDSPSTVSVVDVADGRITPIDLGIAHLNVVGWLDEQRVLLVESEQGVGPIRYLDVPVAAPDSYSVIPFPAEVVTGVNLALSPDRQRAAYDVTEEGGQLAIADLTRPLGTPMHVAVPGGAVAPAWSPDGSEVLLVNWTEGLWIVNADGTDLRQVAADVYPVGDPWQPMPAR